MNENTEKPVDEQQDYYDKKQEKNLKNFKYDMKFIAALLLFGILFYLFFS